MFPMLLDTDFSPLAIIDEFKSIVWSYRYKKAGDFEFVLPINSSAYPFIQKDLYVSFLDLERPMIVDTISITTDPSEGNYVKVTGASLESILKRRIIDSPIKLSGKIQNGIKKLINDYFISPSNEKRKISNFRFLISDDPNVTELEFDTSEIDSDGENSEKDYIGKNVYDVIESICTEYNLGFRVTLSTDGFFDFLLYSGVDRSYNQDDLPFVVFSPKYDNLLDTNYYESNADMKTNAYVIGTDAETDEVIIVEVEDSSGGKSGLERREMSIQSTERMNTDTVREIENEGADTNGDRVISASEQAIYDAKIAAAYRVSRDSYKKLLKNEGKQELLNNSMVTAFDGRIENTEQFSYAVDFFLGDIVQVANEYGKEARSRVEEIVFTKDASEETMVPTFVAVDDKKSDD